MMCYYCHRTGNGQGMRMLPVIHIYVPEVHTMCATKDWPEPPTDEVMKSIALIKSKDSTVSSEAKRLRTTARRLILIMLNRYGFDCSPFIKAHRKHGRR